MDQAAGHRPGVLRDRDLPVELPVAGTQAETPPASLSVTGHDTRSACRGRAQGDQFSSLSMESAGIRRVCAAFIFVRSSAAWSFVWPLLSERPCFHGLLPPGVLFCRPHAGK